MRRIGNLYGKEQMRPRQKCCTFSHGLRHEETGGKKKEMHGGGEKIKPPEACLHLFWGKGEVSKRRTSKDQGRDPQRVKFFYSSYLV